LHPDSILDETSNKSKVKVGFGTVFDPLPESMTRQNGNSGSASNHLSALSALDVPMVFADLGSGLIDHSQNMTTAAMQMAEK
jgi:hypothetical protein